MRVNIYASFNDTKMAKDAVGALLDHGVQQEDITLILPVSEDADMSKETERAESTMDAAAGGITTTTVDDAAVGATKGAFLGFGLGSIAALVAILVPGVGLVVGGGALATALAGAAGATIAGTVAGGVTGYLKDQGVPDDEIDRFSNIYEQGGAILNVSAPSANVDAMTIETVLRKFGEAQVEIWRNDPVVPPIQPVA